MAKSALDWDDLRIFLEVARRGSLSSAARELRVTQPTVGRRLSALEQQLKGKLFRRLPTGLSPTPLARELLVFAERMEFAAASAELAANSAAQELRGRLRVTAAEWFAVRVLAPLTADFTRQHPALEVELIADARWLNLPRREADIALRSARFEQPSIIQRKVARVGFGLYAAPAYLEQVGAPDFTRGCEGHALVAMSEDLAHVADLAWLTRVAGRARIAARSNGREVQATMAASGVGLACLPRFLGERTPGLVRLHPPAAPPERGLWLGVNGASQAVPSIAAFRAFLVAGLSALSSELDPRDGPRPLGKSQPVSQRS